MDQFKTFLSEFVIKGNLDHFEGTNAVIITGDNQKLLWPTKNLPDNIKQGEIIKLTLTTDKLEKQNRDQLAKNLLNHILKK